MRRPEKPPSHSAERKDGGSIASRTSPTPLLPEGKVKSYDKAAESRKWERRRRRAWDRRAQKYRQSAADTVCKLPLGSVRDALTRAPGAVVFCFAASRDTIETVIREARTHVPDVRVFDPVVGSDIHLLGGRYGELGGGGASSRLRRSNRPAEETTETKAPAPRLICLPYAYANIFSFDERTAAPSFVSPIKAFSPTVRAADVTSVIFTVPCPFGDAMPCVAVREYHDTLAYFARDAGELAEICGALAPNEALEVEHSRDGTGPPLRKLRLSVTTTTTTKPEVRSGDGRVGTDTKTEAIFSDSDSDDAAADDDEGEIDDDADIDTPPIFDALVSSSMSSAGAKRPGAYERDDFELRTPMLASEARSAKRALFDSLYSWYRRSMARTATKSRGASAVTAANDASKSSDTR